MSDDTVALVEVDETQVDICVKYLMQHLMNRKPWGGKPPPVAISKKQVPDRVKAFIEVEAMIHAAIVAIAYCEAVEGRTFQGLSAACDIINCLFITKDIVPDKGAAMILEGVVAMGMKIQ